MKNHLKKNFKNILFITVDSLRYDRLGIEGYPYNLTPTIDSLANNGIYCTQTIAHSSTTQMSHPSISTSTLPLDFGGYDEGIINRPVTLAEILKSNGFNTVSFSAEIELSDYFGYTRGFEEYYPLTNVRSQWDPIYFNFIKYYLKDVNLKKAGNDTFDILTSVLRKVLNHILQFCHNQKELKQKGIYISHPSVDVDHQLVITKVTALLAHLNSDTKGFISFLQNTSEIRDFYNIINCQKKNDPFLLQTIFRQLNKYIPYDIPSRIYFNYRFAKGIPSRCLCNGALQVKLFEKWINQNERENNFVWICLGDVHDMYFTESALNNPFRYPLFLWNRLKNKTIFDPNLLYDLSVKYEDKLISRLKKIVSEKWGLEETLIVICSDHGRQWYMDGRYRKRKQRNLLDFYEEDIRVPMIFSNPKLEPKNINHLCGLIDLAPTIIDLIGLNNEPAFKGFPVYSQEVQERPYLIMEDADQGPCDIQNKPIRLNVRTPKYKYLWKEAYSGHSERNELYDLTSDPGEEINIVNDGSVKHVAQNLKAIIRSRYKELKTK